MKDISQEVGRVPRWRSKRERVNRQTRHYLRTGRCPRCRLTRPIRTADGHVECPDCGRKFKAMLDISDFFGK